MDRAKTLKDGKEITVFAHDLSSKGRKRIAHGARFKCPYCGRPVDLAALDSQKSQLISSITEMMNSQNSVTSMSAVTDPETSS